MIRSYKDLVNRFFAMSGQKVMSAQIANKFLGFALSIIVIRILTPEDYGLFAFSFSIFSFLLPINALGLNHSLLRFGAISKSYLSKQKLLNLSFSYGLIFIIFIIAISALVFQFIPFSIEGAHWVISLLLLQLFGIYLVDLKKNYARLLHQNDWFAFIELKQVALYFVLSILGLISFGLKGYICAMIISPLIASISSRRIKLNFSFERNEKFKEYLKYGVEIGLGSIASSLLFFSDIIFLGFMNIQETEIAFYRTASLLPVRLIFIPVAFLSVEYVTLSRNYESKPEIMKIVKNYLLFHIPLAFFIFAIFDFYGLEILVLFFGNEYEASWEFLEVFKWVIPFSFLMRALFGNVLAALGKSNWNARVAWLILLLNLPLNYFAILEYGAIGAAYATTLLIGFSGIILGILFFYYLNSLKKSKI